MNNIEKGELGEKVVNEIASNAYLKYWCYPSPKDINGDKKEICDLLILFKEHAIIISVKNYEFKGKYIRYFRATLKKAISQIQGAERKLFSSNAQIEFLHPDLGIHSFLPTNYKSIHRIIVNLSTVALFYPGCKTDKKGNCVHVFNWSAFLNTVNELNTISDFVSYLTERERVLQDKDLIFLTGNEDDWNINTGSEFHEFMDSLSVMKSQIVLLSGNELDLLAVYLANDKKLDEILAPETATHAWIQLDNNWNLFLKKQEVINKKSEEILSYFIDEFIKKEVLYYSDSNRLKIAAELLSLNRFERRILGQSFRSFLELYKKSTDRFTAKRFGSFGDTTIGFFIHGVGIKRDDAMLLMELATLGFSLWEKYKSKKIIMLGIDSSLLETKFVYYDVEPLTQEEEEDITKKLKLLHWFENLSREVINYKEYPEN